MLFRILKRVALKIIQKNQAQKNNDHHVYYLNILRFNSNNTLS